MENTKTTSIILVLICTLFTSAAQVLYKAGANNLDFQNWMTLFTNWQIGLGILLYGIAAVLLIFAFKHGELSVIFPMISTSYIWVSLLAVYYFGESFTTVRIVGIIVIILGVTLIGVGGKQHSQKRKISLNHVKRGADNAN